MIHAFDDDFRVDMKFFIVIEWLKLDIFDFRHFWLKLFLMLNKILSRKKSFKHFFLCKIATRASHKMPIINIWCFYSSFYCWLMSNKKKLITVSLGFKYIFFLSFICTDTHQHVCENIYLRNEWASKWEKLK